MKESNSKMNEIVSVKNKNNLDGYKLVYPNNKGLIVRLYKENQRLLTRCDESCYLRFFESLCSLKALFIEKSNYQETLSKSFYKPNFRLIFNSFKDDSFKKEYNISKVKFINEQQEKIEIAYPKRIKKIYVNIEEETVVIMIDDNFCSKHEKKQTAKMKAKEEFTSNIKDLLN
jgi:hypothetical protein